MLPFVLSNSNKVLCAHGEGETSNTSKWIQTLNVGYRQWERGNISFSSLLKYSNTGSTLATKSGMGGDYSVMTTEWVKAHIVYSMNMNIVIYHMYMMSFQRHDVLLKMLGIWVTVIRQMMRWWQLMMFKGLSLWWYFLTLYHQLVLV